jgi:hypothetical protein
VRTEFGGFWEVPVQFQSQNNRGAPPGIEARPKKIPEKAAVHRVGII